MTAPTEDAGLVMQAVPKDSSLMREWERYSESPDYRNSFKWAADLEYRKGSMWAAFLAGWQAMAEESTSANEPSEERIERAARAMFEHSYKRSADDARANELPVFRAHARAALLADAPALVEARIGGIKLARDAIDAVFEKGYISASICKSAIEAKMLALQADLDKERGKTT